LPKSGLQWVFPNSSTISEAHSNVVPISKIFLPVTNLGDPQRKPLLTILCATVSDSRGNKDTAGLFTAIVLYSVVRF